MNRIIHSRLIRWLIVNGVFFLVLMTLLRVFFNWIFRPPGEYGFAGSFWMGFRYDIRVIAIVLLIVLLAGMIPVFRPFDKKISRWILLGIARFFGLLIILIYTFDFAHFDYLSQRLNASVLNYAEDTMISAEMVWQSYPVVKILLAWIACFVLLFYSTRYLYRKCAPLPEKVSRRNRAISYLLCFFIFAVAIYGRVGLFPLRWSDAYRLSSNYKAVLSLNPFQSFASSLKYRKSGYDLQEAKKYYPLMSEVLGVDKPDSIRMDYQRANGIKDSVPGNKPPNIVLVICESFSSYKSSMWGNPLNTTPYFNELCKQGIFFKNCFTPTYGTARGVWAIVTGIPDVSNYKTASRNPAVVDQQTILNDMAGYEKFYFIGGSASWANIRGVLTGNIKDLNLFEEEDYESRGVDVWGISDKELFLEANQVMRKQEKPFVAIIQTANNHRPYTIPEKDRPFVTLRSFPKDSLEKFGFGSNEELNGYTYMDYSFKVFMETARKEKYFDNTIFVFVGDHGIRGNVGDMFPVIWTEHYLSNQHVPMLFYAPALIRAGEVEKKVSQLDIMPSVSYLANLPVRNKTLGRNVFSETFQKDSNSHAFVLDPDMNIIGLLTEKYYYEYNHRTKEEGVFSATDNRKLPPGEPDGPAMEKLRNLTRGYYETARYMLFNNKKDKN